MENYWDRKEKDYDAIESARWANIELSSKICKLKLFPPHKKCNCESCKFKRTKNY